MIRRDLTCRCAGAAIMAASCTSAQLEIGGAPAAVAYFLACIAGIVLAINGQHVLTVIRAERRGHALTAAAIHAARLRRRAAQPFEERR